MKKSVTWFTLIEVIITIVIIALLIGLIFNIFVTIGRVAVYVQLRRAVHSELMYTVQTLQNMVDNQEMQLTWYDFSASWDPLTQGRKTVLNMADETYVYQIERTCTGVGTWCYIELSRSDIDGNPLWGGTVTGSVTLTDEDKVQIESFLVRKLPYEAPSSYQHILHEGFRMLLNVRVPQYDETKRRMKVDQYMQFFFTMRKYE